MEPYEYHFLYPAISTLTWLISYNILLYMLPHRSAEFSDRLLTLVHGSVTAFVGVNECFTKDLLHEGPQNHSTTQQLLLIFSLGYFVFDLSWCVYYRSETNLMYAHHIYSCFALWRIIYMEYSGSQAACGLGCMEVSNPLLQARWYARALGYHNTPLFISLDLTFIFVFVVVRIFFGTFFLLAVTFHPYNNWEFRIISLAMYLLSWFFVANIINYVKLKYFQVHQSRREAAEILTEEDDLQKSASS